MCVSGRPSTRSTHDFTVSTGGFCCFIHDLDGSRRPANGDDVLCAINMVNHLDQIDYTGLPVSDQTVPADHRPVVMAAELAKWTRKIGGIETFTKDDVRWIHEIAQIVAGSAEEFRRRPALVGYAETRTPLCFDRNMVEVFMEYVKLGVPQTVDTMPAGGTTAPVTARRHSGPRRRRDAWRPWSLGLRVRDDAVVAMDITPSYADMRTGLFKYSGCDRWNLLMARVQLLSEYYGCPTGVHGGKTDSCFYNEQAGAEKMSSMLLPVLAGAVGIGTVGHLENADHLLAAATGDRQRTGPLRAPRDPHAVGGRRRNAGHRTDPRGRPGRQFPERGAHGEHFRDELFLSPLSPVRPWAESHTEAGRVRSDPQGPAACRRVVAQAGGTGAERRPDSAIDAIVKRAE